MLETLGKQAKEAAAALACAPRAVKDNALLAIADALIEKTPDILAANAQDLENGRNAGMNQGLLDRLALSEARIVGMAQGVREVAAAADPVGRVLWGETRPNGLQIRKVSVPLGVIAVIFEARPNVTSDAAALCLKAGNAVIVKHSSDNPLTSELCATLIQEVLPENLMEVFHTRYVLVTQDNLKRNRRFFR